MNEIMERVANTIRLAIQGKDGRLSDISYGDLTVAVIEAMREPTEAMTAACWTNHHPWRENAPAPEDRPDMFAEIKASALEDWRDMIDAALADSPPESIVEK